MNTRTAGRWFVLALALSACGRVGFPGDDDVVDSGMDGASDAARDTAEERDDAPGPDGSDANDADDRTDATDGDSADALDATDAMDAALPAFTPRNVGARVALDAGSADLVVDDALFLANTDTGAITRYTEAGVMTSVRGVGEGDLDGIVFRRLGLSGDGASGLGVFAVGSLDVPAGTTLHAIGSRPCVILAATEVHIEGTLSVAANRFASLLGRRPGAGGGAGGDTRSPGSGPSPGQTPSSISAAIEGGGGGALGGAGGAGGGSSAGAGGDAIATDLAPIVGGSGGGGAEGGRSGEGGGGGGALQVSAVERIVVLPAGVIDASGAGGRSGQGDTAGGGGGSGGAVLLESPEIVLRGAVGANGGSGGQGGRMGASPGAYGAHGADGSAIVWPAPRTVTTSESGAGGRGSTDDATVESGLEGSYTNGGGGGGAGRIHVCTRAGTETYEGLVPSMASGLATVGTLE